MNRQDDGTVRQIRGSALLLAGTVVGRIVNGATQILLARALTKTEYGAFAYGLAFAAVAEVFATLGLTQAVSRYVPLYEERKEYGKALGTIVFVFGTIVSLGLLVVVAVSVFAGSIERLLVHDRQTVATLAILVALVPIEATNRVSEGVLAVVGRPGMIFVRKNVLTPVLRLVVVGVLVSQGSSTRSVAVGYVAIGVLGILAYGGLVPRAVQMHGFPLREAWHRLEVPVREITTFVAPLLVWVVVWVVIDAGDALVLGRYGGAAEVAALRAVQPLAMLMQAILYSFTLLFTTLAARLYAREDHAGLNDAYWRTATWISLLTLPILIVEVIFGEQLTTTLYGRRYADSASVLAILAIAYFVQASMSLNGQVLAVYRRVRYILVVNVVTLGACAFLLFTLVPALGAEGAALAKVGAMIIHSVLMHIGLRAGTGVRLFETRFARLYVAMGALVAVLWLFQRALHPTLVVALLVTGAMWLALVAASRRALAIGHVFPELRKVPLARYLVDEWDEV